MSDAEYLAYSLVVTACALVGAVVIIRALLRFVLVVVRAFK